MSTLQATLTELIETPSHVSEEAMSQLGRKYLEAAGFEVTESEVAPGRRNLFAIKNAGAASKAIMFYGHLDTVSPAPGWDDATTVKIEGDRCIGLGSYDMKGGFAAMLEATKDTAAYVKVFMAVDEENISTGAWHAMEHNADFFQDVELVISGEPNFNLGLHGITRGRTGRVIFQASFQGRAVHIAQYQDGKDAVEMAAKWITELYAQRETLLASPQSVIQVRKISAESIGMSVCAQAQLEVEVLLGAGESIEQIAAKLRQVQGGSEAQIDVKPRPTPYLLGYHFDSFPHQELVAQAISDVTHQQMELHDRSSVGDDNVLATLGIPVITWGPDGGNAHTAGEWVSLSSLKNLATMYAQVLSQVSSQ